MKAPTLIAALGMTSAVSACLLESERALELEYARTGVRRSIHPAPSSPHRRQTSSAFPIGTGDRFAGGCKKPVGLGVEERDLESVLSVAEVTSALRGLKRAYPNEVELFTAPVPTYEGREIHGAVVGDDPRVFIMSGIHARERGGPDNTIYFLADLLAARKAGTGVSYGAKNYTAEEVETALSAGVIIIPLTNPDGVYHDQTTDSCWRKNRNPESAVGAPNGRDIGIDLNRNYDFIWDFEKYFDTNLAAPASNDPRSEVFCGTAPESEPETQAVVWTLEQYHNITWFMDLHSYGPSLLYAWGNDDAQTEDPEENFDNPAYDGLRGGVGPDDPDNIYREFFTAEDLKTEEVGTAQIVNAMLVAGDAPYEAYPAVGLYPTSGASNDWAMSRAYGNPLCGSSRMFGYTMEFGAPSRASSACPFYPDSREFHRNVRQVGAGFMEMMLLAAGPAGDPVYPEC
ncbi:hypothetical protein B0I35DRAFT_171024 [Stachybotrys elegans]|uniref:Peptidase M14 domain-containing protein n=1 Tax=Stachybotrys elegans TaxID=80388 RepID=A0A8K0T2D4_9HYPO|nr:hypothetical protein B0I35DRAFT_171024 [Stachybotrys elegans]